MPMEQHKITNSRLTLGCMWLGGAWNRSPLTNEDILTAEKAIDAALSIGINMFDHADIYKIGKAEEVFGRVLKERPSLRSKWYCKQNADYD